MRVEIDDVDAGEQGELLLEVENIRCAIAEAFDDEVGERVAFIFDQVWRGIEPGGGEVEEVGRLTMVISIASNSSSKSIRLGTVKPAIFSRPRSVRRMYACTSGAYDE